MKRTYALRNGFHLLSTEIIEASNGTVAELLLSCATNSVFLNCDEGVKLLSLIFSIPELLPSFHEIVKESLVHAPKTHSLKYAEVYFRTWKNICPEHKLVRVREI